MGTVPCVCGWWYSTRYRKWWWRAHGLEGECVGESVCSRVSNTWRHRTRVCVRVSLCVCVCVSLSLSLARPRALSLHACIFVSMHLCMHVHCLCLTVCLSVCLCMSNCIFVFARFIDTHNVIQCGSRGRASAARAALYQDFGAYTVYRRGTGCWCCGEGR